jgi:hypothetical protein
MARLKSNVEEAIDPHAVRVALTVAEMRKSGAPEEDVSLFQQQQNLFVAKAG